MSGNPSLKKGLRFWRKEARDSKDTPSIKSNYSKDNTSENNNNVHPIQENQKMNGSTPLRPSIPASTNSSNNKK